MGENSPLYPVNHKQTRYTSADIHMCEFSQVGEELVAKRSIVFKDCVPRKLFFYENIC